VIAYLDSSVVLRVVLGQQDRLREWKAITHGVASALLEVECLRTIDRLRTMGALDPEDAVARREAVYRILEALELVELSPAILRRAAQAMPTPLGTLDAIHLATAELWREVTGKEPLMATHDGALALAARASGFRVAGV
jgi:predicted nucleic acid-binding protein